MVRDQSYARDRVDVVGLRLAGVFVLGELEGKGDEVVSLPQVPVGVK